MCTVPSGEGKDSLYKIRHTSGRQTQALSYPVGTSRGPPVYTQSTKGRLQTAFQRTPKPVQGALHHQRLRRLRQTKCPVYLYSRPSAQRRYRSRAHSKQLRILQSAVPGPKTRQSLEASYRLKFTKQVPGDTKVQDGDPRIHTGLPQERRMGYLYRSHGRIPTCTYPYVISKISQIPPQRRHLPVCQSNLWSGYSSSSFYQPCQGCKTTCTTTRNQTTPIPGRLVNPCPLQGGVPLTNTSTTQSGERLRLCSKPQEVRTPSLPEVRLPRIPFFTGLGSCEAHARQMDKTLGNVSSPLEEVCYQCKDSYVHHWIACINREDCKIGQDAYDTFSVTSQESLEISDVLQGEFFHPREHEKLIFTDASNAGWGAHSGQDSTGGLWSHPEKHLHIK